MIKHQGVLLFLGKLGRDAPAAKSSGIMLLYEPSPLISHQQDVLQMTQAADLFVKNDYKHTPLHGDVFSDTLRLSFVSFVFAT